MNLVRSPWRPTRSRGGGAEHRQEDDERRRGESRRRRSRPENKSMAPKKGLAAAEHDAETDEPEDDGAIALP